MALQQDTKGTFGEVIPAVYWVPGEVRILPGEGTALVTAHGYQNQAAWDTVKTIRTLKAKQETEQAAWRVARTNWEAAHPATEPFTDPEPFESIPAMPPFIRAAPVVVPLADYLTLETQLKSQSVNFWGVVYGVLKDPSLSQQFEGAQNV